MRLWQREQVWVWLVGLEAIETAPNLESAKTSDLEAESPVFIDRPDFFDYPDSDQARLLALAQFTGESPVIFVDSEAVGKGPKELDQGVGLSCMLKPTSSSADE
ncbi:Fertilization-influencing membrane protein [Manis javanica]|nr:Fertilization-influencing membrane protein [Manis javanica]